ncbi:MAG TPA: transposase [Verrucomicrobiae bacterium]|nr:transposase [Verrucomicrobiae bacterium]
MSYNPALHHRRSIRLKGYNYANTGAYFVTICTQGREGLFGEIKNGEMELNPAGRMVTAYWTDLSKRFSGVETDEFAVMPNHFHGIIVLVGADRRVCPDGVGGRELKAGGHIGPPLQKILQWFKTMTTNEYLKNVKNKNWPPFPGRLWQRNYYEHIIRDEDSLNKIREYIIQNPARWEYDMENTAGKPDGAEQDFWKVFG